MKSGFQWINDPVTAFRGLVDRYILGIKKSALETLVSKQAEMEDWMKSTASWQDRTGNARTGLRVEIQQTMDSFTVIFVHSVYYGQYLEYDFGGKYAILNPAMQFWTPILMKEIQEVINTKAQV